MTSSLVGQLDSGTKNKKQTNKQGRLYNLCHKQKVDFFGNLLTWQMYGRDRMANNYANTCTVSIT